jgi:hypothetical protein
VVSPRGYRFVSFLRKPVSKFKRAFSLNVTFLVWKPT